MKGPQCSPRSCGPDCQLTVTCGSSELCTGDDCTTCTAETVCGDEVTPGTYTWELNGAAITANNGDSVEICPEDLNDGANTVTASNTNLKDSEGNPATANDVTDAIDLLTVGSTVV